MGNSQCNKCRNDGSDCKWTSIENKCVRFMPIDKTNLTHVNVTVETPPNVDCDMFSQYFMNWIDSMGWICCGFFEPEKDD